MTTIREARIRVIYNDDHDDAPWVCILINDDVVYDGPPMADKWDKDIIKPTFQCFRRLEFEAKDAARRAFDDTPVPGG